MNSIATKIEQLRAQMRAKDLAAYIVLDGDPHQSEYVAPYWKARTWMSGFTGSAGTLVVTAEHAGLWTDARYFSQADQELEGSPIVLQKLSPARGPEYINWLAEHLPKGSTVGIDGRLLSLAQNRRMARTLHEHNLKLDIRQDLITNLWKTRPSLPTAEIFEVPIQYTGQSRSDKLDQIRKEMQSESANAYLVSALDEIAWTLNLRGRDIAFNPVFMAYLFIKEKEVLLFVEESKIADSLKEKLNQDFVRIKPYTSIQTFLSNLRESDVLLLDNATTTIGLYQHLPTGITTLHKNIISTLKAIKNSTEIAELDKAMVQDGIALLKAYRWLEEKMAASEKVTEFEMGEKISYYRSLGPGYYGESFPPIVGYQANGAIVHYRPDANNSAYIEADGLLLIDSGGQYFSGTTDITRTTSMGKVSEKQKEHYTLVLKGHIALARQHYPKGTKGYHLDILARQALWNQHLDYGHGTGHGVGHFLNVHEGPQGISLAAGRGGIALREGMITSNEPGFYQDGSYGIRIENLVLTEEAGESPFGNFLKFRTLTYFPIQTNLIQTPLLTNAEIEWLNAYHALVWNKLGPELEESEKEWLRKACEAI